jgi:phytoene/squalene synthetase
MADTIEDDRSIEPVARRRLFSAFESMLTRPSVGEALEFARHCDVLTGQEADLRLCGGAPRVMTEYATFAVEDRESIQRCVLEMVKGMREFCERADREGGIRIRDHRDLTAYCHYVAGTVGDMLTLLFSKSVPAVSTSSRDELKRLAASFGRGLQLVNIAKDVLADAQRGDVFLPADALARAGIRAEDVMSGAGGSAQHDVVQGLCALARTDLAGAVEYTLLWPAGVGNAIRQFCAVPIGLALATLHALETGHQGGASGKKTKVSREFTFALCADVALAVDSNQALGDIFIACARGENAGTAHGRQRVRATAAGADRYI